MLCGERKKAGCENSQAKQWGISCELLDFRASHNIKLGFAIQLEVFWLLPVLHIVIIY